MEEATKLVKNKNNEKEVGDICCLVCGRTITGLILTKIKPEDENFYGSHVCPNCETVYVFEDRRQMEPEGTVEVVWR